VLLPFFHKDQIVGYTGRHCETNPGKFVTRYWNSQVPDGFLFNSDVADIPGRQVLVLVEGPFDAIAVQGVAAMGSSLSEHQIYWLASQNAQKIVLPDQQKNNQGLIDTALSFGWAVSFPDWEPDIKDAADACKRYGQIYTITSVLSSYTTNPITIGLKRQFLKG
jgi:hypothetical protein